MGPLDQHRLTRLLEFRTSLRRFESWRPAAAGRLGLTPPSTSCRGGEGSPRDRRLDDHRLFPMAADLATDAAQAPVR